jgi:site-specific recombinase XerD
LSAKRKAAATINKNWHAIKAFSRFIKNDAAIEEIKVVKPKNIKEEAPESLESKEVNKLIRDLENLAKDTGNYRDLAMVYLMLEAGLRVDEVRITNICDMEITERKGNI